MHRFWIWMIPLLAAICALFFQAAVHGYDPDRFTVGATAPLERPPTTNASSISPDDSEFMPMSSLRSSVPTP
jgi:hypothetical protein